MIAGLAGFSSPFSPINKPAHVSILFARNSGLSTGVRAGTIEDGTVASGNSAFSMPLASLNKPKRLIYVSAHCWTRSDDATKTLDHDVRFTIFSDYALRVLMYAAAAGDELVTIEETAEAYNISRGHLMKVVNILTRTGYIEGVRGRSGGFTLAKPAEAINLGAVVRTTEPDFALVECFAMGSQCIITKRCRLPGILDEALDAFLSTLDRYTLADIMLAKRDFIPPRKSRGSTRPAPRRRRPA